LSNLADIHRIVRELVELTHTIDIGIIVNNAGLAVPKFRSFVEEDPKLLEDILTVNFIAGYKINAAMLPILRNRKQHRSAILNLSSGLADFIAHGNGTYSASKVIQDIYSRTLAIENRDRIDVLSVKPFGVTSGMMSMSKGKFMISPKECVLSTLADLGTTD
jgi:short-subunit dehydrogenase